MSFAGHQLILQESGLLTTLCCLVIWPMPGADKYVACACNVGDSLAFVYSPRNGVREITQGLCNVIITCNFAYRIYDGYYRFT